MTLVSVSKLLIVLEKRKALISMEVQWTNFISMNMIITIYGIHKHIVKWMKKKYLPKDDRAIHIQIGKISLSVMYVSSSRPDVLMARNTREIV